jgi:Mg-chelatase subunit ChlD
MHRRVFLAAAAAVISFSVPVLAADEKPASKKPQVEVVFCLDTTGSMGGLIEGAKQKIWSISNQIAGGKPAPQLKIGLVAYRDRGDAYITKVFELTDDLDAIYGHLKEFKAQGGGDGPESVNQALHDAVHKIRWSTDKDTLRIIFLVGDAPPHMDYKDDVKYPETCKIACEKAIIINTIQCGSDAQCRKCWQEIALKAEGTYVPIQQDGGVVATVATPFDKRLAEINGELTKTTLVYGSRDKQLADGKKNEDALKLAAPAAAERAAYNAKAGGQAAAFDLLDCLKRGTVKLEELKKEELPAELQKMTLAEQKAHLEKLDRKRTELTKEALDLDRQRQDYIARETARAATKDKAGFDGQVLETLRKQAKKNGIEY